ncbi:MAG: hypothetical protein JOZ78_08035 [Chroococcidiopsidaceae cyanobacterium CP_BM_ER_R8_30]|nr:hypothetical protein [Chroococcidiopsidaceae cyanobacterium CP_BM_ER_R8_30]
MAALALVFSLSLCVKQIELGYNNLHQKHFNSLLKSFFDTPIAIEYIGLNIIYLVWIVKSQKRIKNCNFKNILKTAFIFISIAFLGYPTTNDVYLYLQYGLMDLNGINPFIEAAGTFTSELSPLLYWKQTAAYGPISQLYFMIASYFLSISLVFAVYIFKSLCLLMHTINSYLIWRQLKFSPYQNWLTLAYLINPELLFEQVTNAHVDVLLSTILIILTAFLRHRYYSAGIIMIWLGFLTKTIPVIWLPLFVVFLIRQQSWKSIQFAFCISLVIFLILHFSILPTLDAWRSLLNPGVEGKTAGSLHNVFIAVLDILPISSIQLKNMIISAFYLISYIGFSLYYIWVLLKTYFKQSYSEVNLIVNIGWVTLTLFLFATPWYQPWYTSILLAITALNISYRRFVLISLIFCITSNCSYYALGFDRTNLSGIVGSLLAVGPAIMVLLIEIKRHQRLNDANHKRSPSKYFM